MAGIGDNVAIIGDWVPPPSPSTRAFFSSILGENSGFQEVLEPSNGSKTEELLGHCQQMVSGNANDKNVSEACNSRNQVAVLCSISEQKSNSCNGLVERIAARAGFNAPRLNTESIKSPELSLNSDVRSPYLTIPPGLNPTTLLDSPVFVSSSLAHPSPTTRKFSFLLNGFALTLEATDKSKDNSFEDINMSSFAFKPIVESGSSLFLGAANKTTSATLSQQSCPIIEVSVQSDNTPESLGLANFHGQNKNTLQLRPDLLDQKAFDNIVGGVENSPPLDKQTDKVDQRGSEDSMAGGDGGGTTSKDGYN